MVKMIKVTSGSRSWVFDPNDEETSNAVDVIEGLVVSTSQISGPMQLKMSTEDGMRSASAGPRDELSMRKSVRRILRDWFLTGSFNDVRIVFSTQRGCSATENTT